MKVASKATARLDKTGQVFSLDCQRAGDVRDGDTMLRELGDLLLAEALDPNDAILDGDEGALQPGPHDRQGHPWPHDHCSGQLKNANIRRVARLLPCVKSAQNGPRAQADGTVVAVKSGQNEPRAQEDCRCVAHRSRAPQ